MRRILEHPTEALSRLDPAHTALLAIHWQVDVVKSTGALQMFDGEVERSGLIQRATEIVRAGRSSGMRVMYSNVVMREDYADVLKNNPLFTSVSKMGVTRQGTPGAEVITELAPQPQDFQFPHNRLTAFYGTNLDLVLRKYGIDTLITFGIATNVAVDSTVREGVQLGYNVILVADCCCSSSVEYHEASLKTMKVLATEVTDAQTILIKLRALSAS